MPIVNGEYVLRDSDRIAEVVAEELRNEFGNDIDLTNSSAFRHITNAWSESVEQIQEEQLATVYESAYIDTATGNSLENVVALLGISRQEAQRATGIVTFSRSDSAPTEYTIPQGTVVQTAGADPVRFETREQTSISEGDSSTTVNIISVEGGLRGNVSAGSITTMASGIAGVESVTNNTPTGDSDRTDTNNNPYVTGIATETDAELRERAKNVVTEGAVATREAIYSAIVNDIPEVQSASIFVNNTTSDYRDQGGLPPVSFEAVVHGGDDTEIAQTIFDEMALTARSYGGAHGTRVIDTVTASNGQVYQINFSRPVVQDLTIDMTVVVESNYVGNAEIKDTLVSYIGGEDTAGAIQYGVGVGENVIIDTITDLVVDADGPVTGVIGISNLEITDSGGTSLISSSGIGLDVVSISDDTVAKTAPENITITTVEQ